MPVRSTAFCVVYAAGASRPPYAERPIRTSDALSDRVLRVQRTKRRKSCLGARLDDVHFVRKNGSTRATARRHRRSSWRASVLSVGDEGGRTEEDGEGRRAEARMTKTKAPARKPSKAKTVKSAKTGIAKRAGR